MCRIAVQILSNTAVFIRTNMHPKYHYTSSREIGSYFYRSPLLNSSRNGSVTELLGTIAH